MLMQGPGGMLMKKGKIQAFVFLSLIAMILLAAEPGKGIRLSDVQNEPAEAEPQAQPGWDLVVLRPFTSQPHKKYALNEDLRTFSDILAVHFARQYVQDPNIRAWIAIGTPEQEQAIETALFVQPTKYLQIEDIINFDALNEFAEQNQARLILVSDIYKMAREFENKTDPITGKYSDSTFIKAEMIFLLYDAAEKKVLWTGKHGARARLGDVRWNAGREERLSRYGWNLPVGSATITPDSQYFAYVEQFMTSAFGAPYKESYSAVRDELYNLVLETLK